MKPIRVLAVDDDPDFQYLLEQTVGSQPDMELVAVCPDGVGACRAGTAPLPGYCPDGSGSSEYRDGWCGGGADDPAGNCRQSHHSDSG